MFGYGNSCGNIIHQVSSSYFLNLTYIFAIIGIKSVQNIKSNSVFAQFFKKYYNLKSLKTFYFINGVLWFLVQYLFTMKETINNRTASLIELLNATLDAGSFYTGCLCSYILYDQYPLKNIEETQIGSLITTNIPKGLLGSIIIYSITNIYCVLSFQLHMLHHNSITIYFIQKILIYFFTSITISLLLCGGIIKQYKFVDNLSQSEFKLVQLTEIISYKLAVRIGDIKIGPENKTVIFLVAIGTLSVICKFVSFFEQLFKELLSLFECI
ncbi:Hypothetical_protein [Hexamita inflata]|uniref:Hypothetical_protein n=1 Tax=Hexamita inflata TaxID=28002 RepID=A0AA86RGB1_9EUKA|nr:Hypothetical protein HINF_LOCUS61813 [Hexamita inflata]